MARARNFSRLLYKDSVTDTDMAVDGSSTQQVFTVPVAEGQTIIIKKLIFEVHSTAADMSGAEVYTFGAAGALTTGIDFLVRIGGTQRSLWPSAVKTLAHLYRYMKAADMDNLVDGIASGTDLVRGIYYPPSPIRLVGKSPASATPDRVVITIDDDLSGLTLMQVFAEGTETV